ncbi:hypothetical protein FIBSPDRAFT_867911 [Athelia psychrophila]|uniref:Uncharacterized protein n=1 Tax=Athelia psychrophila TaxID=1759441 RepID=A0A166DJC9_9AGAM|nr:hypothetical protein FIBSPDRAFT_867911 [Fibularhizoctonia sp. CBS 109695]
MPDNAQTVFYGTKKSVLVSIRFAFYFLRLLLHIFGHLLLPYIPISVCPLQPRTHAPHLPT